MPISTSRFVGNRCGFSLAMCDGPSREVIVQAYPPGAVFGALAPGGAGSPGCRRHSTKGQVISHS
ncbi:hypothetical protein I547_6302 [Mycobacterium kansasii 824]|nr:hypothetical protein I547_6302 [Mycobacterium kansasii 824]